MSNDAGARLQCVVCGSQGLVVTPGSGTITCCGRPMVPAEPPRGSAPPGGAASG
jgi:desulfoferrodoxin-like iron-binding protein